MSNDVTAPNAQLPAAWQDKMAQYAKTGLASERTTGSMFSTRGGILTFGGQTVPNNRMQVIVVGSMHERTWYSKPWSPDQPASPDCYAFSFDGVGMKPHPEAMNPVSPECKGCKFDEFGSDPIRGKGKACKEQRRLALMPASALSTPDEIAKAQVGYLRIPVTSTRGFSEHVKHCAMRALPVWAVITEVELVPDAKTMWRYLFKLIAPVTQADLLTALELRQAGEMAAIAFPYPKPTPEPPAGAAAAASNPNRKF
jgi:hypothetical protein